MAQNLAEVRPFLGRCLCTRLAQSNAVSHANSLQQDLIFFHLRYEVSAWDGTSSEMMSPLSLADSSEFRNETPS